MIVITEKYPSTNSRNCQWEGAAVAMNGLGYMLTMLLRDTQTAFYDPWKRFFVSLNWLKVFRNVVIIQIQPEKTNKQHMKILKTMFSTTASLIKMKCFVYML